MKIVAWNIRSGGGARCADIASRLKHMDPDVIAFSEYQPGTSAPLIKSLAENGWAHQALSTPPLKYGGAAVVSKTPLTPLQLPATMAPFAYRYVSVDIPAHNLKLRAVYAPLHKDPYADFWDGMLADLRTAADDAVLVVGDLNAGGSSIDSPSPDFFCSSYFTQLPDCGYQDLWRLTHGQDARDYTWLGPVNPYRLDHAFATARLVERFSRCAYDHDVRTAGMSDHSLLSVELT